MIIIIIIIIIKVVIIIIITVIIIELSHFNFKIKYRPGKKSQDCVYLSSYPIENDFTGFTEKTTLGNISELVNSISYEDNWLTVTAKDPEILQTYLQLEPNKDIIKIDCKCLKKEQMNDEVISPVLMQFYQTNVQVLEK